MKILLCSTKFEPDNTIGAVRPTMFANYLSALGHDVTVLTKQNSSTTNSFKRLSIIGSSSFSKAESVTNSNTESNRKTRSFIPQFILSIGYSIRKFYSTYTLVKKG